MDLQDRAEEICPTACSVPLLFTSRLTVAFTPRSISILLNARVSQRNRRHQNGLALLASPRHQNQSFSSFLSAPHVPQGPAQLGFAESGCRGPAWSDIIRLCRLSALAQTRREELVGGWVMVRRRLGLRVNEISSLC